MGRHRRHDLLDRSGQGNGDHPHDAELAGESGLAAPAVQDAGPTGGRRLRRRSRGACPVVGPPPAPSCCSDIFHMLFRLVSEKPWHFPRSPRALWLNTARAAHAHFGFGPCVDAVCASTYATMSAASASVRLRFGIRTVLYLANKAEAIGSPSFLITSGAAI